MYVPNAEALGYRSLPREGRARLGSAVIAAVGEDLARRVPGVVRLEEHGRAWWSLAGPVGVIVPARDREGRIVALVDARGRTFASAHRGGPSCAVRVHVPAKTAALLDGGAPARVLLVAGALTADAAAARFAVPCVGVMDLDAVTGGAEFVAAWQPRAVAVHLDGANAPAAVVARAEARAREALRRSGIGTAMAEGFADFIARSGATNERR